MHRRIAIAAAIVGLLAPAVTQASILSYTGSVVKQKTELINQAPAPVLLKFDSNLGTLTSAEVTLRGFGETSFTITNRAPQAQPFTATTTVEFTLSSAVSGIDPLTVSTSGTTGSVTIDSSTTKPYGPYTFDQSVSQTYTAGDLAKFIGTGDLGFLVNTLSGFSLIGGGGNLDTFQATSAGAVVNVTYNYDAKVVPEPSSVVLAATGLIALGGLAARRHRRKVASV